ncbi:MAG: hypothetical protein J7501_03130 [Bdellovibrio sp.]|nr:hypothetical protein [Bdellovibrio sp.]
MSACSLKLSISGNASTQPTDFTLTSLYTGYTNVHPWPVQFIDNLNSGVIPTQGDFNVTNGTILSITETSPGHFDIMVDPTSDGVVSIRTLLGSNGASSVATDALSVTMDRAKPQVTISGTFGSLSNTDAVSISFQSDEDLPSLPASAFNVTNGTITSITGSGQNFTIHMKATAEGDVSITLPADVVPDKAGNKNTVSNRVSWQYNQAAPTLTISSTAGSYTNLSSIPVTFTTSEAVANFTTADVSVTNGTMSALTKVDDTHSTATVTPTAVGAVSLNIAAGAYEDTLGLANTETSTFSTDYNNIRPTVTLSSLPTWSSATSVDVTVTFSESVTGFTTADLNLTNATAIITGVGASYIVTLYPTAQGSYSLQVKDSAATDKWGNTSQASSTETSIYDSAVPTVVILSSSASNTHISPIPLSFTFSEAVTGFVVGDITAVNGTLSNFTKVDETHYTADLTPSGQGAVSATVDVGTFEDLAGRANTASATLGFTYDTTAPTVTLSAIPAYTGGNVGNPPRSVTVTLSEAVTFNLTKVTLTNATASISGSGISYTLSITPIVEGPFSAVVSAGALQDAAGNTNVASNTVSSEYDTTPPVGTITADAGDYVFESPTTFTIRFNEVVNGLTSTSFTATNWSNSFGQLTTSDNKTFTLKVIPFGTGPVVVALAAGKVTNNVNLPNTAIAATTTYYDNVPSDVSINKKETLVNEDDGATQSFNITMSATKPYAAKIYYRIVGTALTGVDHDLTAGSVTIPAGQTTATVNFNLIHNTGSTTNKWLQVNLYYPNSPALRFTSVYQTRFLIKDVDGAVRPEPVYVSNGYETKCLIDSTQSLYCWGANSRGQVGNGTTVNQTTPVLIDSSYKYLSVSTSLAATCGITTAHQLRCWGMDLPAGQGTSFINKPNPATVDGTTSYAKVVVGYNGSCGLTTTGELKCWGNVPGSGTYGSPTTMAGFGMTPYRDLDLKTTLCVVDANNELRCVGLNSWGQMGVGYTSSNETTPIKVSGTYKTVATQETNTCAMDLNDEIYCWGFGQDGGNGIGNYTNTNTPGTKVSGGKTYKKIVSGRNHICAITSTDKLQCWGQANISSVSAGTALGDGTTLKKNVPTDIDASESYLTASGGSGISCGITTNNRLKCWGEVDEGYLGDNTTLKNRLPTSVDPMESYSAIAPGKSFNCGITTDGTLKCWGSDSDGLYSVGDGSVLSRTSPIVIDSGKKYIKIYANESNVCGIREDNLAYCWGDATNGRLGDNTSNGKKVLPSKVSGNLSFSTMGMGKTSSCAITLDSKLYCWGEGNLGQLGQVAAFSQIPAPTLVDSPNTYKKVKVGSSHACALRSDDKLLCWGSNANGCVGNGASGVQQNTPIVIEPVSGIPTTWIDVGAGENISCAISSANDLYCWGYGSVGAIGLGTTSATKPTQVDAGTKYAKLSIGPKGGCAQTIGGVLKCWGSYNDGMLGSSSTAIGSPQPVTEPLGPYQSFAIGGTAACGIASGALRCWGNATHSTIGDESVFRSWLTPVDVTNWIFQ